MPGKAREERPAGAVAAPAGSVCAHREAALFGNGKTGSAKSARTGIGDDASCNSSIDQQDSHGEARRMTPNAKSLQWRALLPRFVVAGVVLAVWFWTQSLLGARTAPATGIGDALHNLTAG